MADTITTTATTLTTTGTTATTTTGTIYIKDITTGETITPLSTTPCLGANTEWTNKTIGKIKNNETISFTLKEPEIPAKWNVASSKISIWGISVKPSIVAVNVIVPNKVVEVTIYDGEEHTFKQVCKEPDQFDFKYALALAWAKYMNLHPRIYHNTLLGLEILANKLIIEYEETQREFDRAVKAYNKWLKEEEKKKAEEEERKAIIARRREKNKKRKEKALAKKKETEIDIIAEAIRRGKENV